MRWEQQRDRFNCRRRLSRFREGLHNPGPGPGNVLAVVAAPAGADDPTIAVFDRKSTQLSGGTGMGAFRKAKMGDRVTLQAVGTTLQDDEFRAGALNVRLDLGPDVIEFGISGARGKRDIQLCSDGTTFAGFAGGPRTRIEESTIFVDIGKEQVRIVFESVKHAVAVMCIDVYISDPLQTVFLTQVFDGDATIVKDTKARSVITPGMVQPCDRHKCSLCLTLHDRINSRQCRADHVRSDLENPGKCRRITAVEKSTALLRFF
jgi:hypothetical protein